MDISEIVKNRLKYYHEESKKALDNGDMKTANKFMHKFHKLYDKIERTLK